MKLPALSYQEPWAWAILNAGKDIENRKWRLPQRFSGRRTFIHTSKTFDHEGYDFIRRRFPQIRLPQPSEFKLGGLTGMVTITGCVTGSVSDWFFGPFGFTLKDPEKIPFILYTGQLGFFEVDIKLPSESPALTQGLAPDYPARYGGQVPLYVRMLKAVKPEPLILATMDPKDRTKCFVMAGQEVPVWVNRSGAVSAIFNKYTLGLRPDEFEVIRWHK